MDGTIITPKSGKKFGENEFDWKFWDKKVPEVLQKHFKEGSFNKITQFVLCIFPSIYFIYCLHGNLQVIFIFKVGFFNFLIM